MQTVYLSSGGRCAICKVKLYDLEGNMGKGATFSQIAHIQGLNPGSARYNISMTDAERNSAENLILLCPTDHNKIDKEPSEYTVDVLKKIKSEHLKWVDERLEEASSKLTFAELEVLIKYLKADESYLENSPDFDILPIEQKIVKNDLSDKIRKLIKMGLMQVRQVKDYIAIQPYVDFGLTLRNRFVEEYNKSLQDGLKGDLLFYKLYSFATNGRSGDFIQMAAGLAVLVYFFESCEVFEK